MSRIPILRDVIDTTITLSQTFQNLFLFIIYNILGPIMVIIFVIVLIYLQIKLVQFYIFIGQIVFKYLKLIIQWLDSQGKSYYEKMMFPSGKYKDKEERE